MNITLWILQVLLAVVFLGSGAAKSAMSKPRLLATGQTGVAPFPVPVIRVVAVCELLAVAGLILPWATGIAAVLTPLAAVGLCAVMVGAAWSHASLHEPRNVAVNVVLFALASTVAIGRFAALS